MQTHLHAAFALAQMEKIQKPIMITINFFMIFISFRTDEIAPRDRAH